MNWLDKTRELLGESTEHTSSEYDSYLEQLTINYSDESEAKEILDWAIEEFKDIDKGDVEVYRVVFADSKDDIDLDNVGKHWSFEKPTSRSNFDSQGETSFLITAKSVRDSVDIKTSLENFTQIPDENEVNFTIHPTIISVKEIVL